MKFQRGGFAIGLVVGVLVGLAVALGVALYVTRVPVPFVDKVPQRTAEQDAAEIERNKNWDPNAALAGRNPFRPAPPSTAPVPAPSAAASEAPVVTTPSERDPAAILANRPAQAADAPASAPPAPGPAAAATPTDAEGFTYFVQAGAYSRPDEADQQRANLALMGLDAKITEREQSGRTVYRVRVGPFEKRVDADAVKARLDAASVESALVRVQN